MSRQAGVITFDQLNELLGTANIEPEETEAIMAALSAEEMRLQ